MLKKRLHNNFGMQVLGRILGILLATALFTLVTPIKTVYADPPPAPPRTTSWYMDVFKPTTLPATAYNKGCMLGNEDRNTEGTQDHVVILLFGKPAYSNGTWGTLDWMHPADVNHLVFLSTTQIATTVKLFIKGYWRCSGNDTTSQLTVAAGVNNVGSRTTYNHGLAWAAMTDNINSWVIANNYTSQVTVRAAADMEPHLNSPAATKAWVQGYISSYQLDTDLKLYNVGSADGCPDWGIPIAASACDNSWTVDDVWYVSWGSVPLLPIPEIYLVPEFGYPYGRTAAQWQLISTYSANYQGEPMDFPGVLTQEQACQQKKGGCPGADNTAAQGWTYLYNAIYVDPTIPSEPIRWSADIKWNTKLK